MAFGCSDPLNLLKNSALGPEDSDNCQILLNGKPIRIKLDPKNFQSYTNLDINNKIISVPFKHVFVLFELVLFIRLTN